MTLVKKSNKNIRKEVWDHQESFFLNTKSRSHVISHKSNKNQNSDDQVLGNRERQQPATDGRERRAPYFSSEERGRESAGPRVSRVTLTPQPPRLRRPRMNACSVCLQHGLKSPLYAAERKKKRVRDEP